MNLPLAPLSAALLGVVAALGVVAMPIETLEAMVMDSGVASVIQAAEPPLGLTARAMLAGGAGAVAALIGWFIAFILVGTRGLAVGGEKPIIVKDEARTPTIRRADAHPDAPPRPPLLATRDLGTPFLDIHAEPKPEPKPEAPAEAELVLGAPAAPPSEQPLPQDFEQPLAAFDPLAIPLRPAARPVPVAPLHRAPPAPVFDQAERPKVFETPPPVLEQFERPKVFEMPPPVRPAPRPAPVFVPPPPPEARAPSKKEDASVHALLERLERGVTRRGLANDVGTTRQPERGLEDALVTLRNLARRA